MLFHERCVCLFLSTLFITDCASFFSLSLSLSIVFVVSVLLRNCIRFKMSVSLLLTMNESRQAKVRSVFSDSGKIPLGGLRWNFLCWYCGNGLKYSTENVTSNEFWSFCQICVKVRLQFYKNDQEKFKIEQCYILTSISRAISCYQETKSHIKRPNEKICFHSRLYIASIGTVIGD